MLFKILEGSPVEVYTLIPDGYGGEDLAIREKITLVDWYFESNEPVVDIDGEQYFCELRTKTNQIFDVNIKYVVKV